MLTNEQRSHDLALYTLEARKESVIREQVEQGDTKVQFDVYKEYLFLYDQFLEIFNRDFPQNDQ